MALTVLNVAYPFAPVGPDAVGGAEQILTQLDAALVREGHCSLVLACSGSQTQGVLCSFDLPNGPLTDETRRAFHAQVAADLRTILRTVKLDLVHMHGIDYYGYLPPAGPPVLVTLHLPPMWYPAEAFRPWRARTYLHCVSWSQHATCPAGPGRLPPIENGVDLQTLRPGPKADYALALGRICPEKGFHHALAAAAQADVPLLLAGRVFAYPDHERYFQTAIAPRLSARRQFIGSIGLERKRELLAGARCLLVPSIAAETSSLVAMEALAAGTPVIAFPVGALPEIVEHGRTGFLVKNTEEMAAALRRIAEIDPAACRAAAEARFDGARMCARFLSLYKTLVREERAAAADVGKEAVCPAR